MTQLLNPNDTGEIRGGPYDETARMLIGESTINLAPYVTLPPIVRSADATEVIPLAEAPLLTQLVQPLADDLFGLDTGGYPKPKPRPKPKVAWNDRFQEYPTVRPAVPRERTERDPGRHRAGAPWRYVAAVTVGVTLLTELAAVGVSALLGVQW